MLAPIIMAQRIWFRRYHPTGHAAGHLGSATAIFAIAFVVATLVWASSPPLRRRPELWVLAPPT